MISAEWARAVLNDMNETGLLSEALDTVIALSEGRITCARCSTPMLAQDPDNTPGNDNLEICSRCTLTVCREEIG